mmetsp:Transcript_41842/g.46741  ORF Transcript_41842/g.46741 Transcript_41842/m.46741 type:complete len:158 (+) Transcript_41842:13-486(+)
MMQILVCASRRIVCRYHPSLSFSCKRNIDQNISFYGCRQRSTSAGRKKEEGSMYLVQAGLPMFLFCGLGVWVVSSGIEGKNAERDVFQGRISKSERQAVMDKEHDDMMDRLGHVMKEDFDNTKRIERPEEVLERRRKERKALNVWYKRTWRFLTGQR